MFYPLLVHLGGKGVINDLLKFHNAKNSNKKSLLEKFLFDLETILFACKLKSAGSKFLYQTRILNYSLSDDKTI